MNRLAQRAALLAALVLSAAACGEDPPDSGKPDGGDNTPTQSAKVLTRVGPGALEAHPGDTVDLTALLSQSEVGPIAGSKVTFRIVDDETGSAELTDTGVDTDDRGTATTQLKVSAQGEVSLKAESAGATSKAVWKVDVQKLRKMVSIVATNETFPLPNDLTKATVNASAGRQVTLRVRVTVSRGDGEEPLAGEEVTFDILQGIPGAAFAQGGQSSTQTGALTQADGEANVVLAVGTAASQQPYSVTASLQSNETASFEVRVTAGNSGGGCTATSQCPPGRICQAGACIDPSVGGSCGSDDRPCPIGYRCNSTSGQCEPGTSTDCGTCPSGTLCDPATGECVTGGCTTNAQCPDGFLCQNGVCGPGPSDGSIDVSGHWYTKHAFNIAEALPSWVKTTGAAVRVIDQTLQGQLNLPSWANAIISGLLRQYVPEWVYTVAEILDSLFTIFTMLRAEGEMDLVQNGGPRILAGTEYWTSFVFYMLSQCQGQIAGNIWQPPPCARFDVATDELAEADVAVNVKPFAAKLTGTGPWVLEVDRRQVEMKLAGVIKFVVDKIMEIATGYPSLEDKRCCTGTQQPGPICAQSPDCGPGSGALSNLIDCEGVAEFVAGIIPIDVTAACRLAVSAGGQVLAQQLTGITLTQKDMLDFSGQANAYPGAIALEAEELGKLNSTALDNRGNFTQAAPGDGGWNGKFKVAVGIKDVPGRWYCSRNPIPVQ